MSTSTSMRIDNPKGNSWFYIELIKQSDGEVEIKIIHEDLEGTVEFEQEIPNEQVKALSTMFFGLSMFL